MFVEFGFEFCKKLIFYSALKERYLLIKMMDLNSFNFLIPMDREYYKSECKRLLNHVDLPIYVPLLKAMDDFWPNGFNVCDYLIFVEHFHNILYSKSGYSKSCASEKIYHMQKLFAYINKDIKDVESYHLTKPEKQLRKTCVDKAVQLFSHSLNTISFNQIKNEDLIVISYFLSPQEFDSRTVAVLHILPRLMISVARTHNFYLIWVIRLLYNGKANKIIQLVNPIDFTPLLFNEMYPHVSFHFDTIAPLISISPEEIVARLKSLNRFNGVCWSFIAFYLYLPVESHEKFFRNYRPQKKSVPMTISEIVSFVNPTHR